MLCIAVVSIYVLMFLGINVYKSRTIKSDEDFMVAGRGVPVYMLVATLVCTWIGSGMLTVIIIAMLNSVFKGSSAEVFGVTFPMDTDYIAIPAVIVSVTTLIVVSLLTPKPLDYIARRNPPGSALHQKCPSASA